MRKENSDVTELTDERFVAESRKAQIDGLWDENILLRKYKDNTYESYESEGLCVLFRSQKPNNTSK